MSFAIDPSGPGVPMRRACAVRDRYPTATEECTDYQPPRFGG